MRKRCQPRKLRETVEHTISKQDTHDGQYATPVERIYYEWTSPFHETMRKHSRNCMPKTPQSKARRPFVAAKGQSAQDIDEMHQAWCKSLLLQIALWTEPYTNSQLAPNEW